MNLAWTIKCKKILIFKLNVTILLRKTIYLAQKIDTASFVRDLQRRLIWPFCIYVREIYNAYSDTFALIVHQVHFCT